MNLQFMQFLFFFFCSSIYSDECFENTSPSAIKNGKCERIRLRIKLTFKNDKKYDLLKIRAELTKVIDDEYDTNFIKPMNIMKNKSFPREYNGERMMNIQSHYMLNDIFVLRFDGSIALPKTLKLMIIIKSFVRGLQYFWCKWMEPKATNYFFFNSTSCDNQGTKIDSYHNTRKISDQYIRTNISIKFRKNDIHDKSFSFKEFFDVHQIPKKWINDNLWQINFADTCLLFCSSYNKKKFCRSVRYEVHCQLFDEHPYVKTKEGHYILPEFDEQSFLYMKCVKNRNMYDKIISFKNKEEYCAYSFHGDYHSNYRLKPLRQFFTSHIGTCARHCTLNKKCQSFSVRQTCVLQTIFTSMIEVKHYENDKDDCPCLFYRTINSPLLDSTTEITGLYLNKNEINNHQYCVSLNRFCDYVLIDLILKFKVIPKLSALYMREITNGSRTNTVFFSYIPKNYSRYYERTKVLRYEGLLHKLWTPNNTAFGIYVTSTGKKDPIIKQLKYANIITNLNFTFDCKKHCNLKNENVLVIEKKHGKFQVRKRLSRYSNTLRTIFGLEGY